MSPAQKRTEITIETRKVTIIRRRHSHEYAYCDQCSQIVISFTLAELSAAAGISESDIAGGLDSGGFHTIGSSRMLKLCGNSIPKTQPKEKS